MKRRELAPLLLTVLLCGPLRAGDPPGKEATCDLDEARQGGWKLAALIIDQIRGGDLKTFPGLQAWLADFDKVAKGLDPKKRPREWAAFDVDALTIRNPNFWPAYYEVAPADPGLMLLQAGLLMSAGEATRASHLLAVAKQRPGIPKEVSHLFDGLLGSAAKAGEQSNRLVLDGIKLHDEASTPTRFRGTRKHWTCGRRTASPTTRWV